MQKSLFSEAEINPAPYSCEIKINCMTVREATGPKCLNGADVAQAFKGIASMGQEGFFIATLDTKHKIIDKRLISLGTLNASLVHPREVFRPAIADCAESIIMVHNHPSGDVKPSEEDRAITKRLRNVGKLVGIEVLDHVIIGKDGYYSFVEQGEF